MTQPISRLRKRAQRITRISERQTLGRPAARARRREREKVEAAERSELVKKLINDLKLIDQGKGKLDDSWAIIPAGVGGAILTEVLNKLNDLPPLYLRTVLIGAGIAAGVAAAFTAGAGIGIYTSGKLRAGKHFLRLKPLVWKKPKATKKLIEKIEFLGFSEKHLKKLEAWGNGIDT